MLQITLSAAISLDGFIDDTSSERLLLSSPEDFTEIDRLRAQSDAILVGANTLRTDNASLSIKDPALKQERHAQGHSSDPIKVTLTKTGNLEREARFFQEGTDLKLVYCPEARAQDLVEKLGDLATIIPLPSTHSTTTYIIQDLSARGVKTLLVEGGADIFTLFLNEEHVDYVRLSIAPFFVGEQNAVPLVKAIKDISLSLYKTETLGNNVIIHYKLNRKPPYE